MAAAWRWWRGTGYGQASVPAVTALGISLAAVTTRITRSSMVEALTQDYIETARAKGLPSRMVILKHAFRNALIPVVTVFGLLRVPDRWHRAR